MSTNKEVNIEELNRVYSEAEDCDKKIFAEMRSNILLVSGEHYKRMSGKLERGLESLGVDKQKRIRLVKNHTQKITSDIKDMFVSHITNMRPIPANESEISDVKAAQLAESVWVWSQGRINWDDLVDKFVNSFVDVGEVASKIFFDHNAGELKAYEQKINENNEPLFIDANGNETNVPYTQQIIIDEFGNQMEDERVDHEPSPDKTKPLFSGKLCIDKLYPFNLMRAPGTDSFDKSPHVIYRHMMQVEKAKIKFASDDEEKAKKIVESSNKTYKIFDSTSGEYSDAKGHVMIREFYYRQCQKYPSGYYYIATDNVILDEGEIPFGEHGDIAFPIKHAGYDIIETSPRYSSPIRPIRPFQGEINRIGSSMAEAQMIHGHDKMILKTGSTYSKGVDMPGWRVVHVNGQDPMIIPGRAGEQFTQPLDKAIQEMYMVAKIPENDSSSAQVTDPRAELFKSVRQKARFTRQLGRLERFLKDNVDSYIFLCQKYLPDEEIIRAVGKKEAINIQEFKDVTKSDYKIKVVPVSNDYNTMFGKQVELEIIAQYFGKDMPMDMKAAMIKNFPFLNKEPVLQELMLQYESPTNMILALDRGEEFIPSMYDDAALMLKRLYIRIRSSDFRLLDPKIQSRYESVIGQYEELEAKKQEELFRKEKGMIPTGGNLVKCDMYAMNENGKQERITFPDEALKWLERAIAAQGLAQERLAEFANQQGSINVLSQVPQDAYLNQEQDLNTQTAQPFNQGEM